MENGGDVVVDTLSENATSKSTSAKTKFTFQGRGDGIVQITHLIQQDGKSVHHLKLFRLQINLYQMQAPEPISHPVR